jgi:hypothetical protein
LIELPSAGLIICAISADYVHMWTTNLYFILSICSILAEKICYSSAEIEAQRKPTMNMLLVIEADTLYREARRETMMKLFP